MTMTPAEIVAEYKQARTPMKQIGILADVNACDRKKIVDILREAGVLLPKQYQKAQESEPNDDTPAPTINQATLQMVCLAAFTVISRFASEAGNPESEEADVYAFRDRVQGVTELVLEIEKRLNQS